MLEIEGVTRDVVVFPVTFLNTLLNGWQPDNTQSDNLGLTIDKNLEKARKMVPPAAGASPNWLMVW